MSTYKLNDVRDNSIFEHELTKELERGSTTLVKAALKIGISSATLRILLSAEGKIREQKRKGSPITVSHADIARLARDYADSIAFTDLGRFFGVGGTIARKLRDASDIPIWIRGGKNGTKHRYLFRRGDLRAWVDRLVGDVRVLTQLPDNCLLLAETPLRKNFPVVDLVQAIRGGKLTIAGRLAGRPKFGGAILRIEEIEACMPDEMKTKLGSQRRPPRGPYRKQRMARWA